MRYGTVGNEDDAFDVTPDDWKNMPADATRRE
jgi:hypothetical protein